MERVVAVSLMFFIAVLGTLLVYGLHDQYHYVHHDMTFKWKGH